MPEYLVTDARTLVETWTIGTGITDALRRHENARRERCGGALLGPRAMAFHDGSGAIINSGIGNSFIRGRRERVVREVEHTLCEADKWARVRNGEGVPRQRYRRA